MAHLFIADASKKATETLSTYLNNDGHTSLFWDGVEPIENVFAQNKFEIAILDLNYKATSPLDIVNYIIKSSSHYNTQIILTTSIFNKDILTKINALGVNYILIKPYRYQLLSDKIKFITSPVKSAQGSFEPDILKIFLESTSHIFYTLSNISISAGKPFLKSGNQSLSEVSAVINLSSSQVKGSLSINVTKNILKHCILKMLGSQISPEQIDNAALNDICGELCNQIMGRAKQQFLRKKRMSFEISVPTVLSGQEHILDYKSTAPVLVIPFKFEREDSIFVEFCLEINDKHEAVSSDKLQVVVEEGEFIMF